MHPIFLFHTNVSLTVIHTIYLLPTPLWGEIISSQGLVLTNHHCGFDAVQNHSTLEHNYIRDGFWAKSNSEELSNPGLFVTFIIRIEDVTKQILNGVTPAMIESERQSQVDK